LSSVGLFFRLPSGVNGCRKLIVNTIEGLRKLGHEVRMNREGELNGCFQRGVLDRVKCPVVLGPETVVLPSEAPDLFHRFPHWVQPSQWCVDYFLAFPETASVTLDVWAAGIDTDVFTPDGGDPSFDALVYFKTVTGSPPDSRLEEACRELSSLGQSLKVFKYGDYRERDYVEALQRCRYAVWLAGTESQNIAIMEAWSMGVPTYVWDERDFHYRGFSALGIASSAPYYSPMCGALESGMGGFAGFLDGLGQFDPRSHMLRNHTLEHGAASYLDILKTRLA